MAGWQKGKLVGWQVKSYCPYLFFHSESPLRIFFMIVKNKSTGREYSLNPYHFGSYDTETIPIHFSTEKFAHG